MGFNDNKPPLDLQLKARSTTELIQAVKGDNDQHYVDITKIET